MSAKDSAAKLDSRPNRAADVVLSHNTSRYSDEGKEDLKHFTGASFDHRGSTQDWSKAAREGDYIVVKYKSDRSGNILSREGPVTRGPSPTNGMGPSGTNVRAKNIETGKTMSIRKDGRFEETQYLGGVTEVKLWYSPERKASDDPFGLPKAEPGEHIKFEYDGETRIEQVREIRHERDPESGKTTGKFRYRLWYDYDRRDEDGNDPDPEWVTTEHGGSITESVEEIEVVNTVTTDDYSVTPDEWEWTDSGDGYVRMTGYKDGEEVAERTFKLSNTKVKVGPDWLDAGDDEGGWGSRTSEIKPDSEQLAATVEPTVEGADTGGEDE